MSIFKKLEFPLIFNKINLMDTRGSLRVLAVSDRVDPRIYSVSLRERFSDIDCVISCGDLPEYYLDFIVSSLNVPLFFVHGNHDPSGGKRSLAGGVNLDEQTVIYRGCIFAGLEGSPWYNGNLHQYSERDMYFKYLRLLPKLLWNRVRFGRYLDVLVTHAPPRGMHEGQDAVHKGFSIFTHIIRKYRPKYHLHGHVHLYDRRQSLQDLFYETLVINCYNYRVLEIEIPSATGG
jgi:hypothetical protein